MSQPKIVKKFTETPYFGSSRSFKVIDVDIPKKIVLPILAIGCKNQLE